jgi:hypothetical protein
LALGRNILVVFIIDLREWTGREDGSGGPRIIELGREEEKDQKVGEPFHRQSRPRV